MFGPGPRMVFARFAFLHGDTAGEGVGDQRQPISRDDTVHRVGLQNRRGGVGPALRHTHQHAVVTAHPHQVVGEGQVGQQLPLPHHGMQVIDGVAWEHRVLGEQITESGHAGK